MIHLRLLIDVIDPFGENKAASDGHNNWSGRASEGRDYASEGTDHGNAGGTGNHELTHVVATTGSWTYRVLLGSVALFGLNSTRSAIKAQNSLLRKRCIDIRKKSHNHE
jgi:hypothetical protein